MNVLRTSKPMKVYKPYVLPRNPPQPQQQQSTDDKTEEQNGNTGCNSSSRTPPQQPVMMMPPQMLGTAVFPPGPPPQTILMYQIVPGGPKGKDNNIPGDLPPGPPPNGLPQPGGTPASKTKPRTIHEYYDQHTFQWREFNPEDTVVGDETDPFIVYFRYASKSIGARRTPWLLPKHKKLVKIMQDCLPDFDWRTGEDLLVLHSRKPLIEDQSASVISPQK